MINDWSGISHADAKLFVGPGWHGLIDKAYKRLPEGTFVTQVKEKYGSLRIYITGAPMRFHDLLHAIENRSMRTCEICGNPGSCEVHQGWWKTYCIKHKRKE